MAQRLLDGLRVLDLGGDPSARAARVLGDLGADVVRVVPPTGDTALRQHRSRVERRQAGGGARRRRPRARRAPRRSRCGGRRARRTGHAPTRSVARAPQAVWVRISPFGGERPARGLERLRPRRDGRLRRTCTAPAIPTARRSAAPSRLAYAHSGPEAAFAAMTALASGLPQRVDLSMQEVVLVANMAAPGALPRNGRPRQPAGRQHRPHPRDLADARRLRLVRAARRQGARAEPRDPHQARGRRRRARRRAREPRLERLQPEHRDRRRPRGDRGRRRRVLRRATRCRSSTTSRSRPT